MFIALQSPKVINYYFRIRIMIPAGYASKNVLCSIINKLILIDIYL